MKTEIIKEVIAYQFLLKVCLPVLWWAVLGNFPTCLTFTHFSSKLG